MLEYLIDNNLWSSADGHFSKKIGIPVGTNRAALFADLFVLYSNEAEFVQGLLKADKKHLAQQLDFTYSYIEDVLSLKKIQNLQSIWKPSIHVDLTKRKQRKLQPPSHTWIVISTLTMESLLLGFTKNFNFPIVYFHS